jgi:hypothetical protein
MRTLVIMTVIGTVALVGCASQADFLNSRQAMATQTAVSRGRFDLNCPSANGEVLSREVTQPPLQGPAMMGEERGLFTVGVAGCGQRQVYQVICPMGGDGCTALEGRTPQVPLGYVGFPLCRRMFQINLIPQATKRRRQSRS